MTIESDQRIAFLKKIHLFRGLTDEQVTAVAGKLEEETRPAGEVVLAEGKSSDRFFLIFRGKVRVTRTRKGAEEQLAVFVAGDFFGEMGVTLRGPHSASVITEEETLLLVLTRQDFVNFIKQFPKFKINLAIVISSRRLAYKLRFKWLRPDEVIYFLARKHSVLLYQALIGPVFTLLMFLILIGFSTFMRTKIPIVIDALAVLFIIGWAIWKGIDWGNDYYIVTNQRVVWLEKVIGIYDSRQEAPLSTILSVGVQTSMTGRMMDYGDVIVRTFVGRIPLSYVSHPQQAATIIEEYWHRSREVSRREEVEAMKQVLRVKLGLAKESEPALSESRAKPKPVSSYRPSILMILSRDIFRLRFDEGGTITYRKHLFVLMEQVSWPTIFCLVFTGAIFARLVNLAQVEHLALITTTQGHVLIDPLFLSLLFVMGPLIFWWVYQYLDWSNDIFQVTPDQILDIDRKPFGTEQRRSAPLENILSTKADRVGLLGVMFNFGNVYISVGSMELVFEDVYNPVAVQLDIDQRRIAHVAKKREAENIAERDFLADVFAEYHRSSEEIRREQENKASQSDVQ
jgi:CRP-like cAMP-binding protein